MSCETNKSVPLRGARRSGPPFRRSVVSRVSYPAAVGQGTQATAGTAGGGPTTEVLRPVLELAWAVAKAGTQARPPIAPPPRLRPFMPFAELPERAMGTIRRVIDEDAEFRAKVAQWAEHAALDEEARLWLVRPRPGDTGVVASDDLNGNREKRGATSRARQRGSARARLDAELARLQQMSARSIEETAWVGRSSKKDRAHLPDRWRSWRTAQRRSEPRSGPPPTS